MFTDRTSQNEQVVRQAIDVGLQMIIESSPFIDTDQRPFDTAADGTCHVTVRCSQATAGKNEFL